MATFGFIEFSSRIGLYIIRKEVRDRAMSSGSFRLLGQRWVGKIQKTIQFWASARETSGAEDTI